MSFTHADVPDQSGRTILITGANTGIGFEAAGVLAGKGFILGPGPCHVILACRDREKAEWAMSRIMARYRGEVSLRFLQLDLADLASVRAAAEQVERLDVLINNAGIMHPPYALTKDGFESQFGVNHLGHFALTGLLLHKLSGPDPRVVTVSSIAHKAGRIDFDNLDGRKSYSRGSFYNQSKLANLLFMAELDRRLRAAGSPVKSIGCHPGVSGTDLGRQIWLEHVGMKLLNAVLNPPARAALPTLQAATDPTAQGGDYFGPQGFMEMRGPSGPASRTARACDADLAARLWDVSVELTGVDPAI